MSAPRRLNELLSLIDGEIEGERHRDEATRVLDDGVYPEIFDRLDDFPSVRDEFLRWCMARPKNRYVFKDGEIYGFRKQIYYVEHLLKLRELVARHKKKLDDESSKGEKMSFEPTMVRKRKGGVVETGEKALAERRRLAKTLMDSGVFGAVPRDAKGKKKMLNEAMLAIIKGDIRNDILVRKEKEAKGGVIDKEASERVLAERRHLAKILMDSGAFGAVPSDAKGQKKMLDEVMLAIIKGDIRNAILRGKEKEATGGMMAGDDGGDDAFYHNLSRPIPPRRRRDDDEDERRRERKRAVSAHKEIAERKARQKQKWVNFIRAQASALMSKNMTPKLPAETIETILASPEAEPDAYSGGDWASLVHEVFREFIYPKHYRPEKK